MENLVVSGVSAVAIITALVELIKRMGIPSRFAPIFAIAFGVGFSSLIVGDINTDSIVTGLISGLAASGLWSGAKAVVTGK